MRTLALVLTVVSLLSPLPLAAADVTALAAGNMRWVLDRVAPSFTKESGHKLLVTYGPVLQMQGRVVKGDAADLLILPHDQMEELARDGKLERIVDIFQSRITFIGPPSAPKLDWHGVEAWKRSLLAAPSIAYTDPDKGGYSGILFTRAMAQLGILEEVKARAILSASGGAIGELVAKRGAAVGAVQQGDVDFRKTDVDPIGTLPEELKANIPIGAAIVAAGHQKAAAARFLEFMTAPAMAQFLKEMAM